MSDKKENDYTGNKDLLGSSLFIDRETLIAIQNLKENLSFFASQFNSAIEDIGQTIKSINDGFQDSMEFFRSTFVEVVKEQRKAEAVEAAGWLPHSTTPFHLIPDDNPDKLDISAMLESFYRDNWDVVEKSFTISVNSYHIDEEAKSTFREALRAHREGLYRATVRTLFPEIERVASYEFYGGKHRDERKRPITSLSEIRSTVHDLPAGDVISYNYGMRLFKKIEKHLYEYVGEDGEAILRFSNDPVPNRHAALHGIVSYSTMKNSLNTIIMTDFLFHIMSRMKKHIVREVNEM